MAKRKGNRELRKPKQNKEAKVEVNSISQLSSKAGPAVRRK